MDSHCRVESGSMGRVAYARIAPNEDLVLGVEKLCLAEGFKNAFVRGALGSLVDACLLTANGKYQRIQGPAVEIVSLAGEVRSHGDGSSITDRCGCRYRRQHLWWPFCCRAQSDLHDIRGDT
jgi:uncharacterized protein